MRDGEEDLATMLAVAEEQKARATRELGPDDVVLYVVWGLAWLVGLGAMWLAKAHDAMPFGLAGALFGILLIGAAAVTTVHIGRRTEGVDGVSRRAGAMYGWTWFLAFAAVGVTMAGASRAGAGEDLMAMLWTSSSCLVVGVLYLTSGALWQDTAQYVIGGWILIVGAAGSLVGVPGNLLLMSLAGGGGFLAAALAQRVRRTRA